MPPAFGGVVLSQLDAHSLPSPITLNCSVAPLPVPRASVVWINLPDGAVLFSPDTEVYYGLNNVGAVIWEQLSKRVPNIDSLCEVVHERFPDGNLERIYLDVLELFEDFARNELVDSAEGPKE